MREAIVEAALAQFHERGFNAAAVKDITDRAGVPKGSFYNHFESKEALAIVALQRYGEGPGDWRISPTRPWEPVARIRAHFEFLRDEVVGYGNLRGCCSATSAPRSSTTATPSGRPCSRVSGCGPSCSAVRSRRRRRPATSGRSSIPEIRRPAS